MHPSIIAATLAILIPMALIVSPSSSSPPISYSSSPALTNSSGGNEGGIFTTDSRPYGLTYGEWTAKWWQWAYSIPSDVHPAYDDNGKYCAEGQSGPVWFLAGTYEHGF
jgi:hypothetical protein